VSTRTTDATWGAFRLSGDSVLTVQAAPQFRPAALVVVYDGQTGRELWHGIGKTDSDNPNSRISSQDALVAALANFPSRPQKRRAPATEEPEGAIGVRLQIYSTDGNSYLPTIIEFAKTSPARDAGLKEKDRIVSVDGQPLTNLTFSDANRSIRGRPGSDVTLQVLRNNRPLTFKMKRAAWPDVWGSLDPK
jgi:membrane-associated protease RseP (regulator of RpoE activity)